MNKNNIKRIDIRDIELKSFSLGPRGVLYFSPGVLGLIESDRLIGEILKNIEDEESLDNRKKIDNIEEIVQKISSRFPEDYIREMLETIKNLVYQNIIGIKGQEPLGDIPSFSPLIRLVIANTNQCNMNCIYCYNHFNDNKESFANNQQITPLQLKRALKLLARLSGHVYELELLFIGGEPLLCFDLIREAVHLRYTMPELKNKHIRIFIITNGTLLNDHIMDYCSEHNIHIKLSIDGDKTRHDQNRIFPDGSGSYDSIEKNMPQYFYRYSHPCKAVTSTVDSYNMELLPLVEHLVSRGFNQIELTELYGMTKGKQNKEKISTFMAKTEKIQEIPLVIEDKPFGEEKGEKEKQIHDHRIPLGEKKNIIRNYKNLVRFLYFKIRSRQYVSIIPLSESLFNLHTREPKIFPCRTGLDSIALFTDGNFYPCHHFMGDSNYIMGSIEKGLDGQKFNSIKQPSFRRINCKDCWARFLCGGGCYHRTLVEAGDYYATYQRDCFRKKAIFKEMILLYHRLKEEDPSSLEWYLSCNLYP